MASIIGVETLQHTNGTTGLTIASDGKLTATQGFESGTFTPTFSGSTVAGSQTYVSNSTWGRYQKIGDWVNFTMQVRLSAGSGATGSVDVGGLPFDEGDGKYQALTVGYVQWAGTGWGGYGFQALLKPNSKLVRMYYMDNSASTNVGASNINGVCQVYLSGVYKA